MINYILILVAFVQPPQAVSASSSLEFREDRVKIIESGIEEPTTGSVLYDWSQTLDPTPKAPLDIVEIGGGRKVVIDGAPGTYGLQSTAIIATVNEDPATRDSMPIIFEKMKWRVEVTITPSQLPRPPPEEEKPDEPEATAGPRNAVILYPRDTLEPQGAETAALVLRKTDQIPVFYSPASRDDEPPAFRAEAYEAAFEVGLPALVVMDGEKVNRAMKLPDTAEAIRNEVKKP